MPVKDYFGGSGDEVMSNMQDSYRAKKGKQIFYATANARNAKPKGDGLAREALKALSSPRVRKKIG